MLPYLINGLVEGAIYALIALGYTMVYGILGMINFAHGEIYMLGGYAGVLAIGLLATAGVLGFWVPLAIFLAFLFGILVCAAFGAAMERIAYRPLRGAPVLSPLISAIGSSFFLWNFVMVCQGNLPKRAPGAVRDWLISTKIPLTEDVSISALEVGILTTSILMMVGLQLFIHKTRLGKAMRATAQDRTMASLVGIPVDRVITSTFVIGSGLAAVAGLMFAMYVSVIQYLDGYLPGIKAFTAAVLGGIGNVPGAMLGGFVLGIAENAAMWEGSQTAGTALLVAVLAFSVIFFPLKRRKDVSAGRRWLIASSVGVGFLMLKYVVYLSLGAALVVAGLAFVMVFILLRRREGVSLGRRWLLASLVGVGLVGLKYVSDLTLPPLTFLGRTDYKHVYAFVILILVLIFRPRGILGERVAEKV